MKTVDDIFNMCMEHAAKRAAERTATVTAETAKWQKIAAAERAAISAEHAAERAARAAERAEETIKELKAALFQTRRANNTDIHAVYIATLAAQTMALHEITNNNASRAKWQARQASKLAARLEEQCQKERRALREVVRARQRRAAILAA